MAYCLKHELNWRGFLRRDTHILCLCGRLSSRHFAFRFRPVVQVVFRRVTKRSHGMCGKGHHGFWACHGVGWDTQRGGAVDARKNEAIFVFVNPCDALQNGRAHFAESSVPTRSICLVFSTTANPNSTSTGCVRHLTQIPVRAQLINWESSCEHIFACINSPPPLCAPPYSMRHPTAVVPYPACRVTAWIHGEKRFQRLHETEMRTVSTNLCGKPLEAE